jgi:hypothetical protein
MDLLTLGLGVILTLYGIWTLVLRTTRPEKFRKLGPMKDKWGNRAGFLLHFFSYTLLPVVIGIYLILAGLEGRSVF